jgi:hypothetical protein
VNVFRCVSVDVRVHVCLHVYVCCVLCMYKCVCLYMCIYVHAYVYVNVCIYVCVCVYMLIYVCNSGMIRFMLACCAIASANERVQVHVKQSKPQMSVCKST